MTHKTWLDETGRAFAPRSVLLKALDMTFLAYQHASTVQNKASILDASIRWAKSKEGGVDWRASVRNSKKINGLGTVERLFSDLAEDAALTDRVVQFLTPPAAKPAGLTAEFLQNPLMFMRTHSMSPPDDFASKGWGSQDFGTLSYSNPVTSAQIAAGNTDGFVRRHKGAGGIRHVQVIPHTAPNFPGATTFKVRSPSVTRNAAEYWLPIYWLPWQSLKIMTCQIPEVPASLVDWEDEEYPLFFFTAGINGCSIFAHGSPKNPQISHAGISGTLKVAAGKFWRQQMKKTRAGFSRASIRGEVDASQYMFSGTKSQKLAKKYLRLLNGEADDFELAIQSPFGCVFGIRYGRSWTLYLQQSIIFEKVRFFRKGDLVDKTVHDQPRFATASGIFAQQYRAESGRPAPPTSMTDDDIYSASTFKAMPLRMTEMFPNRRVIGDLLEVVEDPLETYLS